MKLYTRSTNMDCEANNEWPSVDQSRTLVFAFGAPELRDHPQSVDHLRSLYPKATLVGCSSAGEIFGQQVLDQSTRLCDSPYSLTGVK